MIEHASELIAVAGGALVLGMTSKVLIVATTTRKHLRHEREGIRRLMLDGGAHSRTTHTRTSAIATMGDAAVRE